MSAHRKRRIRSALRTNGRRRRFLRRSIEITAGEVWNDWRDANDRHLYGALT